MQYMHGFFHQNLAVGSSLVLLLGCSAVFSGTETALFSLTPEHARRLRSHGRSRLLLDVLQRKPSELLSAILLGNLVVNILFFCTGSMAISRWTASFGALGETLGGMLILILVILFGEIAPKAAGVSHPVGVLRLTGLPLAAWYRFSRPACAVIDRVLRLFRLSGDSAGSGPAMTSDELKVLLDSVRHEPGFGTREKLIMEDILDLSDLRVREIMIPRVQLFIKRLNFNREEVLRAAAAGQYSHVLVCEDSEDDLLGYIKVRDLFFDGGKTASADLICPLQFVPETKRVDQLLKAMMLGDWPLAAVVDEYGGLAGLVTLEDLFSEVMGDMALENDLVHKIDENTYRLDGQLPIREWKELLTGMLPGHEVQSLAFDTLGGFVMSLLGRMPRCGDSVSIRNLKMTVKKVNHRRIQTVLLHLNLPEGER